MSNGKESSELGYAMQRLMGMSEEGWQMLQMRCVALAFEAAKGVSALGVFCESPLAKPSVIGSIETSRGFGHASDVSGSLEV